MCSSTSLWLWEALLGAVSIPAFGNRWGSRGEYTLLGMWPVSVVQSCPVCVSSSFKSISDIWTNYGQWKNNPNPTATLNITLGLKMALTFCVFSCSKSWEASQRVGEVLWRTSKCALTVTLSVMLLHALHHLCFQQCSAVSEMALNIKQNNWHLHVVLPWLHTSPVSLVKLDASKKGKNWCQLASESIEMSLKCQKMMFIFLLVSLEVYLYVILTDYSRRYEPNMLWRVCTFVSVFHLLAAADNAFFACLSWVTTFCFLKEGLIPAVFLQQYPVLLGLNLAANLGLCSIASTNWCRFSFCESLTIWMCLYIYKCTECLSKASCHWCLWKALGSPVKHLN